MRHPTSDARRAEHQALYSDLCRDIATPEDITVLRWLTDHDDGALLAALLALDQRCADLARDGADDETFRAAVETFVDRVRELRRMYRRRSTAPC